MVGGVLVKAHRGPQFRDDLGDDGAIMEQLLLVDFGQEATEFPENPFPGQVVQQSRQRQHGPFRFRFRGQTVGDGEPQPPQNSQGILPESGFRVAHTAQNALF